ncbi:hypothetical protein ACLOJK_009984 [Asimina triloba]
MAEVFVAAQKSAAASQALTVTREEKRGLLAGCDICHRSLCKAGKQSSSLTLQTVDG